MLLTHEFMNKYFISDGHGNFYAKDGLSADEIEQILVIDDWELVTNGEHFIQNREEIEKQLPYEYISFFLMPYDLAILVDEIEHGQVILKPEATEKDYQYLHEYLKGRNLL